MSSDHAGKGVPNFTNSLVTRAALILRLVVGRHASERRRPRAGRSFRRRESRVPKLPSGFTAIDDAVDVDRDALGNGSVLEFVTLSRGVR